MSSSCRLQVQRIRTCVAYLAVVTVVCVVSGNEAAAQAGAAAKSYTWGKIDPKFNEYRYVTSQKLIKEQVLLGRQSLAANQTALDDWYRNYVIQMMLTEENMRDLSELRESLMKDLAKTQNAGVHQYLVSLLYDEATKIVLGDYHPAVEYNAMLIIGDLNQTESRMVSGERYPSVRLGRVHSTS